MNDEQRKRNTIKHREWTHNNKDKVKEHGKRAYRNNIEKRKVSGKKYYEDNKERIIKRQHEYYLNNIEKVKEYQRVRRVKCPEKALFLNAKERSREFGVECTITINDIVVPVNCPLLNIPLFVGEKVLCDNSPTLDRIENDKGYIPGNIIVISYKANRMKSNASFNEFELMYLNWKEKRYGTVTNDREVGRGISEGSGGSGRGQEG